MDTTITIPISEARSAQIDRYCALSGQTREQALADMMNIWERLVYIPWTDFLDKERARQNLLGLLEIQRNRVAHGEVKELSLDEINEEIAKARAERRARKIQA